MRKDWKKILDELSTERFGIAKEPARVIKEIFTGNILTKIHGPGYGGCALALCN